MRLARIIKGAATYIPGLYKVASKCRKVGTGGTDAAVYCYEVWLKHLGRCSGPAACVPFPDTVAELGPGDSLGPDWQRCCPASTTIMRRIPSTTLTRLGT
jgi:hypothetical protein